MKIMTSVPIFSWQIDVEKVETVTSFIFLASKFTVDSDCSQEIKRYLLLGRKTVINLDSILKIRDITLLTKIHIICQRYGFSISHIQMWELDHKKRLSTKELTLSNCGAGDDSWEFLDSKEIKPINPKGSQPIIFTGRTDAEAEAPILWPPDTKRWLTGKDPDAGKDWGQEEWSLTEDEMVGWHHQLNGREFEQALGVDGQGSLACCSPWGCRHDWVGHDWVTQLSELNWSQL